MVKRIFKLLHREVRGLHEAAYLLAAFTFLSQILGLVRNKLLAHFVSAERLDFYFAAFRIPDLIFIGIASLVSISVLIPFLSDRIEEDKERAVAFIRSVFSAFFLVICVAGIVAWIFAPALSRLFFPGFTDWEISHELVPLVRIMLLSPILLGASNIFASVTQVYRKFFLYAASPILYNAGIIVSIVYFYPKFRLSGLAYGVVLGAILHLSVQLPFIIKSGFFPRLALDLRVREFWSVLKLSLPRTVALSARELALLALFSIASLQAAGSIAVFQFANDLQSVPLGIIGVSYSMAAFPTLARLLSRGDKRTFVSQVETGMRHIIFWSLPATALLIVLRAHLVRVIYGSGEFGWLQTRLTAAALAAFAFSIIAQSLVLLLSRAYYAAGNTVKPLSANIISAALVVGSTMGLIAFFEHSSAFRFFITALFRIDYVPGASILMLPIGYSIGQMVNMVVLFALFVRDYPVSFRTLMRTFLQSTAAAVTGSIIAVALLRILDEPFDINTGTGILLQGICAGLGGVAAGLAALYGFGSVELSELTRSLYRKLRRRS